MKTRLAILTWHVIQYQDPLFRMIAEHPEIDLTVIFSSSEGAERYKDRDMGVELQWDIRLLEGYRYEVLKNASPIRAGQLSLINFDVFRALRRGRFDAVIMMVGWGSITAWFAALACIRNRIPFFLYGDSSHVPPETTLRARLRARVLRWLFRRAAGFMITGAMNADYYRHYGADPSRFFNMPWAVDNERFTTASRMSEDERRELRARHGIDAGRVLVVFSGKLIDRKDPLVILQAVRAMQHRNRAAVIFMGDGSEKPGLQQYVREENLEQIAFPGFVNQAEMPRIYGMSDVFVLPSKFEPRGAVVNEAMACGLPVVTSTMVGSNGDIVRDGDNGFIFPVGDASALAKVLDRLVEDDALRRRMGQRSLEIISQWDYRKDVEGVVEAMRFVKNTQRDHV